MPEPPCRNARPLARRALLGGVAAGLLGRPRLAGAAELPANPFRDGVTLLIAGPAGGRLDRLSGRLAAALGLGLPDGTAIRRIARGGADGVAGANEFAARVAPDGLTALLLPGVTVIDWLAGDSRSHFDAARFVPVMAGLGSRLVITRPGLNLTSPGGANGGPAPRVAASRPIGPDLPALLGIDLLGAQPVPVFGLAGVAARAALMRGEVDAVLLHGADIAEARLTLGSQGVALFSYGTLDARGHMVADPALPDVPHFPALYARLFGGPPEGPLYAAWRGIAAAAILDFALVLPALTPPAMVALWRQAGNVALAEPAMQRTAEAEAFRPLAGLDATQCLASLGASTAALRDLREWLALRLDWQPG